MKKQTSNMEANTERHRVTDLSLAEEGRLRIETGRRARMPVPMRLREECRPEGQPLRGNARRGVRLHVTKETAVLVRALRAAGAAKLPGPAATPPLSTRDERRRRRPGRGGHRDLRVARPVRGGVLLVHRQDARLRANDHP
jgi:hypothetical protein